MRAAGRWRQACADTGCTVPVIPEHIAKEEGLAIERIDRDEPPLVAYGENKVQIVGQTRAYCYLTDDHKPKVFQALVVRGGEEILMSWHLLMCWGIIHPSFPSVLNPNKIYKIKQGTTIEDAFMEESETILEANTEEMTEEKDKKPKKDCFSILVAYLIVKFKNIFKNDLDKDDVVKTNEPIKIEVREDLDITPVNITNTAEIPIHLRSAAERELERNIKSDVIEKVDHATEWSSRGFFMKKQGKPEDPISVRLVTDFRPVNKILRRPGYPNEGSTQLIKRIPADARCFAVMDLTSGFFQCELPEKYRGLFAFVLPMEKLHYKRLPQGTSI